MPFNNANRIFFWLTFLHDSFGGPIAGQATVACDSFIMIMILQLTAQMEILIHRMQIFFELCKIKIPNNPHMEQIILKNWVQHHNSLHLLKNELNDIFNSIFYIQFMLTTLSACLLTFQLTTIDIISTKFFTSIMQLFCVLLQICMYCATGNLIMEKSRAIGHAVFAMNWVSLTKRTKTGLIQIIMRANTPITFTAGSIIPLSLSTFTSILRLSYSIYNCLPKQ
ncbi:odorant receptor 4-like [Leptopilina boulardi]|uniref:odorant receptor 4-like n=1 Tax=Leptopilina boulardi TaxID=63433 RepID=UPI0021F51EDE|nr:odorant receptor 4-like [Leptopilina boulardi]